MYRQLRECQQSEPVDTHFGIQPYHSVLQPLLLIPKHKRQSSYKIKGMYGAEDLGSTKTRFKVGEGQNKMYPGFVTSRNPSTASFIVRKPEKYAYSFDTKTTSANGRSSSRTGRAFSISTDIFIYSKRSRTVLIICLMLSILVLLPCKKKK